MLVICNYGCEGEAKLTLKNGKKCCSKSHNSCPNQRNKLSQASPHKDPEKSAKIKSKRINTLQRKYGVINVSQIEEVKRKKKNTLLKNFGVTNPAHIPGILNKKRKTCIERFGVDNPAKSKEIRKKAEKTLLETTGYSHQSKNPSVKKQKEETNLKRRGVRNPSQDPIVLDKILKSSYRLKDYIFPSGKIVQVQGYEPQALDKLINEEGYDENDIITKNVDMPKIFWYDNDQKEHRYFPDIYIKSENLIIEVKSTYTVTKDIKKQQKKKEATESAGYKFRLLIIIN